MAAGQSGSWLTVVGQFLDRDGVGVALGAAGAIGLAALRWLVGRPAERRKAVVDAVAMLGDVVEGLKTQNEAQGADLAATRSELAANHERQLRTERRLGRVEQWIDRLPMLITEGCAAPLDCPILKAARPNGQGGDDEPIGRRMRPPDHVDDG